MVERRSPKPEAEGSSPSAPANLELKVIMKNPIKFIQEVKQEAFKVSWPTGKETDARCVNGFCYGSCNVTFFSSSWSSFKVFIRTFKGKYLMKNWYIVQSHSNFENKVQD